MTEYIYADVCKSGEDSHGNLVSLPTMVRREEIVRCRDCKHMHTVRHWLGMDVDECWLHADPESGALGKERTEPDGFCAWASRRDDAR